MLCMHIGDVGWNISPELKELILKELSEHLDGEFSDEFTPSIIDAIETIKSCNRWENLRMSLILHMRFRDIGRCYSENKYDRDR